jgi:hypothetical protein
MDNLQGKGYPQAPHLLGQRKSGVAHIPTAATVTKDFYALKI